MTITKQNRDESIAEKLAIQTWIAASDLCRLLAMFLRLPTEELAQGLLDGSIAGDVADILAELGFSAEVIQRISQKLKAVPKATPRCEDLRTELRREYTRLFTHPKQPAVAIYECLFLFKPEDAGEERPLYFVSAAALDAERCYRKAGLSRAKAVNEPGDHMATELEFMMFLYWRKAQALQKNDPEGLAQTEALIQEFSDLHLQKWAAEFFKQCVNASPSGVYRVLGEIGNVFMIRMLAK